jgi:hypothetical protein
MNKFLSRKLAVTLTTIVGVVLQVDDPVRAGVAGAVAIAYVIAQAMLDKASVERVTTAVETGIAEARRETT